MKKGDHYIKIRRESSPNVLRVFETLNVHMGGALMYEFFVTMEFAFIGVNYIFSALPRLTRLNIIITRLMMEYYCEKNEANENSAFTQAINIIMKFCACYTLSKL